MSDITELPDKWHGLPEQRARLAVLLSDPTMVAAIAEAKKPFIPASHPQAFVSADYSAQLWATASGANLFLAVLEQLTHPTSTPTELPLEWDYPNELDDSIDNAHNTTTV